MEGRLVLDLFYYFFVNILELIGGFILDILSVFEVCLKCIWNVFVCEWIEMGFVVFDWLYLVVMEILKF